ncbi:thaumatin-like protein 1b [Lycium barbarum]|uniref:thaumatin-like protein 1b n=1 Tax=Lycium barbarum TaxID=112863 RepID=UPI00293E9EC2|nr:thaumatin-like protein 1b [Lycium barbarum]
MLFSRTYIISVFFFFFYVNVYCFNIAGSYAANFIIKNNCPYSIWPATLTGQGPQLLTGFELTSQASQTLEVPNSWSGRVWARFVCLNDATGKFTCLSGDCGTGQVTCNNKGAIPPATLVEFTLAGYGGKDFYDISLVDGFNLPVSVVPQNRAGCNSTSCPVDIDNKGCPEELALRNPKGGVIGCKSACVAFQQPQYCCTGPYGSPKTCKPTKYSLQFKHLCPQAYSYAYDDATSTFTCTGADYLITFCP